MIITTFETAVFLASNSSTAGPFTPGAVRLESAIRQASSGDSSCVSLGIRGSITQDQGADTGVRPADQGLAPIQRDEHEAR
jgi:hypothetical protein